MIKNFMIVATLLCNSILFSQEQHINCAKNLLINQNTKNLRVLKYQKGFLAKKINSFSKVTNNTPEELMSSILSASTLDWYNYNREEKKEKTSQDFNYIKQIPSDKYFFELLYKITFEANGFEYAVIKYYLHNNDEVVGFAESMKKIEEKWVTTSESEISQLLFFMIMIDTEYISKIFKKQETNNKALNLIISNNIKQDKLNVNGLLIDLEEGLSSENEELKLLLDPKRLFK
ncbi:hypothetical protein [Tenacibaculum singaporense]|uniref:hypothetical protein n=1 Tax=Tenacibaculum singaporense TaxID=2358479 RepID=UPI000F663491|nr:hypothetical protein [Tenacibaculum singaporense]RSC93664.1 hypothetical protein EI424_06575 [Tenacibaculum singaporense]